MDDGRWEEVFLALYGDMPKYRHLKGSWSEQRIMEDAERIVVA